MKYHINIAYLVVMLAFQNALAQEKYFEKYNKELRFETFINNTNSTIKVDIKDNIAHEYLTNTKVSYGIAVKYKWIILPISLINSNQIKDSVTVRSKIFNFAPEIYIKGLVLSGLYHRSKGFYFKQITYLNNDTIENINNFPDITFKRFQVSSYYLFNHKKFNLKALNAGTAKQLKSAGSFALGIYFNQNQFQHFNQLYSDYKSRSVGIHTGYLHNFVFWKKRANAGLGIMPQIGYQKADAFISRKSNVDYRLVNRINISLNFKKWYLGAIGQYFVENQNQEIQAINNMVSLYVGLKFNPKTSTNEK